MTRQQQLHQFESLLYQIGVLLRRMSPIAVALKAHDLGTGASIEDVFADRCGEIGGIAHMLPRLSAAHLHILAGLTILLDDLSEEATNGEQAQATH